MTAEGWVMSTEPLSHPLVGTSGSFVLQKGTLEVLEIKLDARYQRLSRMLLAVSPALACELTSDVER
jgi:hypothetical protein